jgi:hypothetical protein
VLKKKIWANFQRIIEFFTQKIVTKLSKVWVWDPRSGIRKKPIPDLGSTIQGSKRHRIPDPDPQQWFKTVFLISNGSGFKWFSEFGSGLEIRNKAGPKLSPKIF